MGVDRRALRRFPGRKCVGRQRRRAKNERAAQVIEAHSKRKETFGTGHTDWCSGVVTRGQPLEVETVEKQSEQMCIVEGAGGIGASVNGKYFPVGSFNGRPKYKQQGGEAIIFFLETWKITDEDDVSGWYYQKPYSQAAIIPPAGKWTMDGYDGEDARPAPILMWADHVQAITSVKESQPMVFCAGPLGILWVNASGEVTEVYDGHPAKAAGVQVGWQIVRINGVAYSDELLKEQIAGSTSYEVIFGRQSTAAATDDDAQPREAGGANTEIAPERRHLDEGGIFTLFWEQGTLTATTLSGEEAFSISDVQMPTTCLSLKEQISECIRDDTLNLSLLRDYCNVENQDIIEKHDDLVLKKAGMTLTFRSGEDIGLEILDDTGTVITVSSGQANDAGVEVGWRIIAIDRRPYSAQLLSETLAALDRRGETDHTFRSGVPDLQDCKTISFHSRKNVGVRYNNASGIIRNVRSGQANDTGVEAGWRIMAIDGMPYTVELVKQIFAALEKPGEKDHAFTFQTSAVRG